jgi:hypothetical protein
MRGRLSPGPRADRRPDRDLGPATDGERRGDASHGPLITQPHGYAEYVPLEPPVRAGVVSVVLRARRSFELRGPGCAPRRVGIGARWAVARPVLGRDFFLTPSGSGPFRFGMGGRHGGVFEQLSICGGIR